MLSKLSIVDRDVRTRFRSDGRESSMLVEAWSVTATNESSRRDAFFWRAEILESWAAPAGALAALHCTCTYFLRSEERGNALMAVGPCTRLRRYAAGISPR